MSSNLTANTMEISKKYYLAIILLLVAGFGAFAQQEPSLKNLGNIVESEKFAYQRLEAPHEVQILTHYDLKYHRFFFVTDPAISYISGSVTSYFVANQSAMSSIQFELAASMVVDSAFHNTMIQNINHTGQVITVPFSNSVPVGTLDSVTVYYHGNPATSGFGSFGNEIHGGAPGMWTLSEPYGAADWWPSKNDLTDKIDSIDVYVVTPAGNHVASNGLLISETPYGANSILAHWKHRYPIASYLIAIASTNYARYSDYYVTGTDSLEVLNYVYPEDSAFIHSNTPLVLPSIGLFEQLFTPYPFRAEKYGQAQFGWGGGMEHQTMTFLGGGAFNHEIMAHELAHQWFGDMITCGSWHDIWLNEGFATYCAGLTYEHFSPNLYWLQWKDNQISYVTSSPAGSVYCDDTTSVGRIFDGRLSYSKGALLLHMLRWVVGDNDFFTGIKNYLNDPLLHNGFAKTDDYKAHMEAASGKDLTEFFADWYTGQGYPSYTISTGFLPDNKTSVKIVQTQSDPSVSFFEMPVPIRFYGGGKDTLIVFNNTFSGQEFIISPGFNVTSLVFDPDQWLVSANNSIILAVPDTPAARTVELLPNPAVDFLDIKHNLGKIDKLEIISMDGKVQLVDHNLGIYKRTRINVQNLESGVYLLRLEYKEGVITKKFIVKH